MTNQIQVSDGHDFSDIATRVHGGYMYMCDGMPSLAGCGNDVVVPRMWSKTGTKSSGWLVIHAEDPDGTQHDDIVLTFCPSCAAVVREQLANH